MSTESIRPTRHADRGLNRRQFLTGLGAGAASLVIWPRLSAAATGADSRLVVVLLRGGMDGLAAVPAYGDSRFAALRGALASPAPGYEHGVIKLDGTFGLHPRLAHCGTLWQARQLAVVHAAAPPYHGRSHFEAQDCLENGTADPHGARDGWLNRAVGAMVAGGQADVEGLAIASAMPLMLRGDAPAMTWSPSPLTEASPDLIRRLAKLYAEDPRLAEPFQEALATNSMDIDSNGDLRPRLPDALRTAGRFMIAPDGPRVALVEDGGWDTHARQGAEDGLLARKLAGLDSGLQALQKSLGPAWSDTIVVVVTEFGRTVAVNGSGGTDHGTGGVILLAGGALAGGRIHGEWPGLVQLYQGRDLAPVNDTRSVLKGVLGEHLGIAEAALETRVFPESRNAPPLTGLIHATIA